MRCAAWTGCGKWPGCWARTDSAGPGSLGTIAEDDTIFVAAKECHGAAGLSTRAGEAYGGEGGLRDSLAKYPSRTSNVVAR